MLSQADVLLNANGLRALNMNAKLEQAVADEPIELGLLQDILQGLDSFQICKKTSV